MISPNQEKIYITGGKELSGSIQIPGSKNAALPILAATIAVNGGSKVGNMPHLSDTKEFCNILQNIGVEISEKGNLLEINAKKLSGGGEIAHPYIQKMRASILFLAPVLGRFGEVKMQFPGGCVLGKRSVNAHLHAFKALGAEVIECEKYLHLRLPKKKYTAAKIIMPELSVTATENAIIAAAMAEGTSEIRLAAAEPHVQNLCEFFVNAGIKIEGIGSNFLTIHGKPEISRSEIEITSDYLQAGTFILAGILTNSEITVENVEEHHLDSFFERLSSSGAEFEIDTKNKSVTTKKRDHALQAVDIQTGVFPKFPTDLHPQFSVFLSQCEGRSKIFETLFERKFAYLLELEKMGADVEIQNPHVFYVSGKTELVGVPVASQDIRAGAAMLLAALVAQGTTEISNIHYIHRGYEHIEENLRKLGADITVQ